MNHHRFLKNLAAMRLHLALATCLATIPAVAAEAGSNVVPWSDAPAYPDGRPNAHYRLPATDQGIVMKYGDGPNQCDYRGIRDLWVWKYQGLYYMHYDGTGPKGWLACLATSDDLVHWKKKGPVLDFGPPGSDDSASASYATTYFDGQKWDMFYMGTPHVWGDGLVPAFPYLAKKAVSLKPTGPWIKQPEVRPMVVKPGTYYSTAVCPGPIMKQGEEYLMFFSASDDNPIKRTLSIARTKDLNGSWDIQPEPILPLDEQIENISLYFEPTNQTWFLFTNHVGLVNGTGEVDDSIWVYWSKDLTHWDPANKAVVLDKSNCKWSKIRIGLPSVMKVGNRLAILYDAPAPDRPKEGGMDIYCEVGLAWLDLPLRIPGKK